MKNATNKSDPASVKDYDYWIERLGIATKAYLSLNFEDPNPDELIGLIHGGSRFFDSDDRKVRLGVIRRYLLGTDMYRGTLGWSNEKVRKKARSVLANHFFKIRPPWYSVTLWADLCDSEFYDATKVFVRNSLVRFLCCAREGISQGKEFYEWNFAFFDNNVADADKTFLRDDRIISDFFTTLVRVVLDPSVKEPMKSSFNDHRDEIIEEAFIRCPWILLMYELGDRDVALLEKLSSETTEIYKRTFSMEPIQGMPYEALSTQSETLTVLKSRLKVVA